MEQLEGTVRRAVQCIRRDTQTSKKCYGCRYLVEHNQYLSVCDDRKIEADIWEIYKDNEKFKKSALYKPFWCNCSRDPEAMAWYDEDEQPKCKDCSYRGRTDCCASENNVRAFVEWLHGKG